MRGSLYPRELISEGAYNRRGLYPRELISEGAYNLAILAAGADQKSFCISVFFL